MFFNLESQKCLLFQKETELGNELMVAWGMGQLRSLDVHTAIFKVGDQQGPAALHRELCSVLCDSLDGRGVWGRTDTGICTAEFLKLSFLLTILCYG